MNDACSRKSCMKTCFISTYSTDSRKTSIQLIPEPSLTFPFIRPCLCKFIEALRPLLAAKLGKLNGSLFNYPPIWVKLKHIFKFSRACVNNYLRMRCHMKGKFMDIKAMIFFFAKDCWKSPKNSLKIVICACKWKFGSTTFHCSNSVMHELWTLNCLSNERREAYLSIHVHLIKKIYDYDSKKLHWIPVSFILGHTVELIQKCIYGTVLIIYLEEYLPKGVRQIYPVFAWWYLGY